MLTTTMSIREFTRNGELIGQHDYIDIGDRKSREYIGVFVSAKHADGKNMATKIYLDTNIVLDYEGFLS